MKITPLEIRQKEFEKAFRGYDKDEVTAFLTSLSQEWERVMDNQKEISLKLEAAEKEVDKLRQVENSLYKTLKTAEDTGANVISQANKTAELHLKEAQMKSEEMLKEAKEKANQIIENAYKQSRGILGDMEEEIHELSSGFRQLENYRDSVIEELKNLSTGLNDKVRKVEDRLEHVDVETHLKRAKKAIKKLENEDSPDYSNITVKKQKLEPKSEEIERKDLDNKEPQQKIKEEEKNKNKGEDTSFFDEI